MYAGGVRAGLLVIATMLVSLALVTPSSAARELLGEYGPFDVYRVGEGVFYAVVDPGNFDSIYNGRLYVVRLHNASDLMYRFALLPALWSLIGEEANVSLPGPASVDILYPRPGEGADRLIGELRAVGVDAALARVLAVRDANVTWVEVVVSLGAADKALAKAEELWRLAGKYAGGRVDFTVVIEGLWPSLSFSEITEVGVKVFDTLVSRGFPLKNVGGAYGLALVFGVDGLKLRELGLTEEEVLEAVDKALPAPLKAVVEFHYFNETLTFDAETQEGMVESGSSIIRTPYLTLIMLAALTALTVIITRARKAKAS